MPNLVKPINLTDDEIPKDENIGEVTITGDYINGTGGPIIEIRTDQVRTKQETKAPVTIEEKKETDIEKEQKPEEHNFYEF